MVLSNCLLKKRTNAQVSGPRARQPWHPAPQHATARGTASPPGSQCSLLPKHLSLVPFSRLHTEFLYIIDVTVGAPMIHEPHPKSLRCTSAVAHQSAQESRLWTGLHPAAHLPRCLCPAGRPATNAMLGPTHGLSATDARRSAHAVCPLLPTCTHSTGCPSPNSTPSHINREVPMCPHDTGCQAQADTHKTGFLGRTILMITVTTLTGCCRKWDQDRGRLTGHFYLKGETNVSF